MLRLGNGMKPTKPEKINLTGLKKYANMMVR